MTTRSKIKGALAVLMLGASILPTCAQAPPTERGNPLIWSSHDAQLHRLDGSPAADSSDDLVPENGVICEPQTLLRSYRLLLSGSVPWGTIGAASLASLWQRQPDGAD